MDTWWIAYLNAERSVKPHWETIRRTCKMILTEKSFDMTNL